MDNLYHKTKEGDVRLHKLFSPSTTQRPGAPSTSIVHRVFFLYCNISTLLITEPSTLPALALSFAVFAGAYLPVL